MEDISDISEIFPDDDEIVSPGKDIISISNIKLLIFLFMLFYTISSWSKLFNIFITNYILRGPIQPINLIISSLVMAILVLIFKNEVKF